MRIVDKYRSTCASCLCHILSLRPFFAAKCLKTAILLNHSKTKGRDLRTDNIVNQGHPAMAIDTLKFSIKFQPNTNSPPWETVLKHDAAHRTSLASQKAHSTLRRFPQRSTATNTNLLLNISLRKKPRKKNKKLS